MQLSEQKTLYLGRVRQEERSISTRLPDLTFSRGPPPAIPQVAGQHRCSPALSRPLLLSNTGSPLDCLNSPPRYLPRGTPGPSRASTRLPRPWGSKGSVARAAGPPWPGRAAPDSSHQPNCFKGSEAGGDAAERGMGAGAKQEPGETLGGCGPGGRKGRRLPGLLTPRRQDFLLWAPALRPAEGR